MLTEVPEKPGRDYLQPTVGKEGQGVKGTLSYQRKGNLRY